MATFSVSFASPDCSFLIFSRGTKSRLLIWTGSPTRMDPSAACTTSRLQTFSLSHFLMPERETFLQLGNCLYPDFVSSTSNVVDGHSNDTMVSLFWIPSTKTYSSGIDVSKPSPPADARKQFHPLSRTICPPVHCLEQLHVNFTRFTWSSIGRHSDEEWLFSLDRVPSVERLLHRPKTVTCVHGRTRTARLS